LQKMALKINTMSFTTIWQESKTVRSFLLLALAVLFFAACRREDSELTLNAKELDYQAGSYFTDTITVNTSTTYVKDTVISSTGVLLCGAYQDPELGNVFTKAFTQMHLANEYVNYTGASVTSTVLRIDYSYGYGDTLQDQTFDVYELPAPLEASKTYYTLTSPQDVSSLTPIGSATLKVKPNTPSAYIDVTIDNAFGTKVLNAANLSSNDVFIFRMNGLAIVPRDQDKGAVIQINNLDDNTFLAVGYTQNGLANAAFLKINTKCARYYTAGFDRSGTALASLTTSYSELPSSATSGNLYLQSMTGLKMKVTFPYIKEFLHQEGTNILVNKAILYLPITTGSNTIYPEPSALAMIMTDGNGKILKDATGLVTRFVQSDLSSPTGTSSTQLLTPINSKFFGAYLSSYFLANQLQILPYDRALLVSPFYSSLQVNRTAINAAGVKLGVYYTIIK
jgi:hypothetical protein